MHERFKANLTSGFPIIGGMLTNLLFMMHLTVYLFCEWVWPRDTIDIAEEFSTKNYSKDPESFGNHEFEVRKPGTQSGFKTHKRYKVQF